MNLCKNCKWFTACADCDYRHECGDVNKKAGCCSDHTAPNGGWVEGLYCPEGQEEPLDGCFEPMPNLEEE